MNFFILFLVTITLVSAKKSVKKSEKTKWYNAEKEMPKRAANLKKICDKYRRNPDFSELYKEVSDPSQNYVQNWASKLFLCVPAENGALTWNRFFRELHNYDLKVQYNNQKWINPIRDLQFGPTLKEMNKIPVGLFDLHSR